MINNWLKLLSQELREEALTHSSATKDSGLILNNERLEFFGDAVLKLIFSEYLLDKFPNSNEGLLTKYRSRLISDDLLEQIAEELKLQTHIITGSSMSKISKSMLGNALEAFIGALYKQKGYEVAKNFTLSAWDKHISQAIEDSLKLDYKSILQEKLQALYKTQPSYELISSSGPDHNKEFEIGVFIEGKLLGQAKGLTKKLAGQSAAQEALKNLGIIGNSGN